MSGENIDFVITWVDGNDPKWQREKKQYVTQEQGQDEIDEDKIRYSDNGLLQYWFRGVETFAPWVHKVFFVTWGHIPAWLNVSHPKLTIVRHDQMMPTECLPTFNSSAIALNLHRIPGIGEKFVFFNDDMYLVAPTKPEIFFKNGLPRDMAVTDFIPDVDQSLYWHCYLNNIALLNSKYKKRDIQRKRPGIWISPVYGKQLFKNLLLLPFSLFPGFYETHTPNSYTQEAYQEAWAENQQIMIKTTSHRFRQSSDVTEWYIRYRQMARGKIKPINKEKIGRFTSMRDKSLPEIIVSGKYKYICINDLGNDDQFEAVRNAFQNLLPEKSDYEI